MATGKNKRIASLFIIKAGKIRKISTTFKFPNCSPKERFFKYQP
jgi:hypothetical protein